MTLMFQIDTDDDTIIKMQGFNGYTLSIELAQLVSAFLSKEIGVQKCNIAILTDDDSKNV